ncbi:MULTISPECIES: methyl-accepting chemotaxis protein [Corallococcus]|uniref:methyl-accepting chemotaxis protein n=1 Tax=Corallococcus TaxID=83461 RepID=UPI00117D23A0|nr:MULTISPECIES: methyl-accepting chemotaxis protein [Corallococcus]NBD13439.1 chemotaxis protein [Corallococcus silvisoli]TSC25834.1 chemotaxis protein [Corallococcus sp. Z5C101001]
MRIQLSEADVSARSRQLFEEQCLTLGRRTDRTFVVLMVLQWLAGIIAALTVSPRAWEGLESAVHFHVEVAVGLGLLFGGPPVVLALARPGRESTRHIIAVGQAMMSGLLVHLTGGRIETHFHIFGSLALLAIYRDWRVLLTFSGVVGADLFLRGAFWPESIFGMHARESWRWMEHLAWVAFEDFFLIVSCVQGQRDLRSASEREAQLELSRQAVEERVVRPLVGSADALRDSMRTLSESTGEQRHELARQARALEETRVTAEEIRQTSLLASAQATKVLRSTEEAGDVGAAVEEAMGRSVEGLADLRAQATDLSERVQALAAYTERIAGITRTVQDLADQSNVLAINAAIEAARVGEAGRGFAVVAREIRGLASQSVTATQQVRAVLDDTRSRIQGVVDLTRQGGERMGRSIETIRASGDRLRMLSGLVQGNADAVRQISASVSQQSAGVSQIFNAVSDLTELMQASVARVEATHAAADSLQHVTDQVHGVIALYQDRT